MTYLIIAGADENGQPSRCNTKKTEAEAQALVDKLVNDMPEGKEAPNAFYVEDPGIDVAYIVADMTTKTIVVNKVQRDSDTRDAAMNILRDERDLRLIKADHLVNKAADNGEDEATARTYRQQLRDLPANTDDPVNITWPEEPES